MNIRMTTPRLTSAALRSAELLPGVSVRVHSLVDAVLNFKVPGRPLELEKDIRLRCLLEGVRRYAAAMSDDWKRNLLETSAELAELLRGVKTVAVLGIRSEAFADRPAHYVAAAVARSGRTVIPVPVHEPAVTTILGRPVVRALRDVPRPVDLVDVFRRAEDVPGHLDDLLALRPRAVWLQSGIRSDAVAEALARAGVQVVQDRCLMVELAKLG